MAQQLGSNYYNSPYKFNGKELDEETGFYYYGARYYDPRISIWQSVDPLAEKYPNVSPYVYCLNNPINAIDPDGRDVIVLNHGPRGKTSVDGGKTNAHKHIVSHQAILVGNNKTGWTYMSYDYDKGENNGKRTNKNDNYTVTKFKNLDDFKNSEHNTFKEDYDDGKGLGTSHKTTEGDIIQRYQNAYQITSDAKTDAKMISAADQVFNEPWSELNQTFSANQCTTVPERALDAGGFKNGEYTKNPGDTFSGTANYLPAAKQKEIERSNKGKDVDNLIKRTDN